MDTLDTNKDGNVSIDEIYHYILDAMKDQAKLKLEGYSKKENVLLTIKLMFPDDIFKKYELMIDKAIDFIIFIANNKKMLKELTKKYCKCLPC